MSIPVSGGHAPHPWPRCATPGTAAVVTVSRRCWLGRFPLAPVTRAPAAGRSARRPVTLPTLAAAGTAGIRGHRRAGGWTGRTA